MGRRPIPIGPNTEGVPPQEAGKVALKPSAADSRPHTFASLRASCSLAASIVLSRAAALDTASARCSAQLIQLETASFRRRSASPSLLCSRAAACKASAKTVCGLRQVRSLRMLIPAATTSTSAWQAKLFGCAIPTPRRPIARPAVQSMSLAAAGLSRDPVMLLPVVAFACAMQVTSHSLHWRSRSSSKEQISSPWFWRGLHFLL